MTSGSEPHEPYAVWLAKVRQRLEATAAAVHPQSDEDRAVPATGEAVASVPNARESFIVALDDPHSAAAEQYRLLAARLEGLWRQPDFQKVAITSASPGEGRSLTTINVACVLAKDFGRQVLVIDGDFRKPSLWKFVGDAPSTGLSDLVAKRQETASVVQRLRYQRLGVLEVGLTPIDPARFWKSKVIKILLSRFGRQYDYVIVDTPPVLAAAEATLIADLMDGVVVVVRAGMTPKAALQKALASLPRAKLVGTVLNGAKTQESLAQHHGR